MIFCKSSFSVINLHRETLRNLEKKLECFKQENETNIYHTITWKIDSCDFILTLAVIKNGVVRLIFNLE